MSVRNSALEVATGSLSCIGADLGQLHFRSCSRPCIAAFVLLPGSPCIDAGDGSVAPTTDFEGNPRYDDPAVVDTGVGVPTYVDIGAYERQP